MQKIHTITLIDLDNNGYVPKEVHTFSTRDKAVAKMKELYEKAAKDKGVEDPYTKDNMDANFHCDFAQEPFLPYAYCYGIYIDYFETDLN